MDTSTAIQVSLYLCCALALALVAHGAASVTPLPRPTTGSRGESRARALRSSAFTLVEPLLRLVGALLAQLLPASLRARFAGLVEGGADVAGLDGDELAACGALAGAGAFGLALLAGAGPGLLAVAGAAGMLAPALQVRDKARTHQREIARTLPAAIDIMSLSMGAGMGFAAALDLATQEAVNADSPLGRELARVRQAIATGQSRRAALEALAHRVPCETVRDFAGAVIQGELKGTPLAGILEIQARTLRGRRAVMAEEAAARASVLLVLPLLLLLGAVLLLMFGPFIVNGVGL